MEALEKIVSSLNKGEIKQIQQLYNASSKKSGGKRKQLFNLLLERRCMNEKEAFEAIYGTTKAGSNWSQLKARLRSDILHIMTLHDQTKYRTPVAQATYDCRKTYMQGEVLLARGLYREGMHQLDKALELAKTYELAAEVIAILDLKRSHTAFTEGEEALCKKSDEITQHVTLLSKTQYAKSKHYHIGMTSAMAHLSRNDYRKEGKRILKRIQRDYSETKSVRVAFYFHLSAMHFHDHLHEWDSALRHGRKLLRLIRQNDIHRSDTNLGGIHRELARLNIKIKKYAVAEKHIKTAQQHFNPLMLNAFNGLETLFQLQFLRKKHQAAQATIRRIFDHPKYTYCSHKAPLKWQTYQIANAFAARKYTHCLALINAISFQAEHRNLYKLNIIYLEILSHYHLHHLEWLDNHLEGRLRKMQRIENKEDTATRFYHIRRALNHLHHNHFRPLSAQQKNILALRHHSDTLPNDPFQAELVPFDQWLSDQSLVCNHE